MGKAGREERHKNVSSFSGDMTYTVLLYYKYQDIEEPEAFAENHREFCQEHNLVGRVLIGKEGINGTVAGTGKQTDAYKAYVRSQEGFKDMIFKEHACDHLPLKDLQVKVRPEIVTLNHDADPKDAAQHLSPEEFHELAEQSLKDDSIILLDARNRIESQVGRFRGAVCPDITFFREFPEAVKGLDLKGKKVGMYCTGGIRCEKASAIVKSLGAKKVYQLQGGIYEYCKTFPDGLFEGSCFVFDDRMQISFAGEGPTTSIPQERIISHCEFCQEKSNRIVNDERRRHRHLIICCEACDKQHDISRIRYGEEKRALLSQAC